MPSFCIVCIRGAPAAYSSAIVVAIVAAVGWRLSDFRVSGRIVIAMSCSLLHSALCTHRSSSCGRHRCLSSASLHCTISSEPRGEGDLAQDPRRCSVQSAAQPAGPGPRPRASQRKGKARHQGQSKARYRSRPKGKRPGQEARGKRQVLQKQKQSASASNLPPCPLPRNVLPIRKSRTYRTSIPHIPAYIHDLLSFRASAHCLHPALLPRTGPGRTVPYRTAPPSTEIEPGRFISCWERARTQGAPRQAPAPRPRSYGCRRWRRQNAGSDGGARPSEAELLLHGRSVDRSQGSVALEAALRAGGYLWDIGSGDVRPTVRSHAAWAPRDDRNGQ